MTAAFLELVVNGFRHILSYIECNTKILAIFGLKVRVHLVTDHFIGPALQRKEFALCGR